MSFNFTKVNYNVTISTYVVYQFARVLNLYNYDNAIVVYLLMNVQFKINFSLYIYQQVFRLLYDPYVSTVLG